MFIIILLLIIIIVYFYKIEPFLDPYSIYLNEDAKRRQQIWYAQHLAWLGGPCD